MAPRYILRKTPAESSHGSAFYCYRFKRHPCVIRFPAALMAHLAGLLLHEACNDLEKLNLSRANRRNIDFAKRETADAAAVMCTVMKGSNK